MIIKIKDTVKLSKDVHYTKEEGAYGVLEAGTEGEVSNIIVIGNEKYILFHPDGEGRIYTVSVNSVTK